MLNSCTIMYKYMHRLASRNKWYNKDISHEIGIRTNSSVSLTQYKCVQTFSVDRIAEGAPDGLSFMR